MKKIFSILFALVLFAACSNSNEPAASITTDSVATDASAKAAADSIAAAAIDSVRNSMIKGADAAGKLEEEAPDNLVEKVKKNKTVNQ